MKQVKAKTGEKWDLYHRYNHRCLCPLSHHYRYHYHNAIFTTVNSATIALTLSRHRVIVRCKFKSFFGSRKISTQRNSFLSFHSQKVWRRDLQSLLLYHLVRRLHIASSIWIDLYLHSLCARVSYPSDFDGGGLLPNRWEIWHIVLNNVVSTYSPIVDFKKATTFVYTSQRRDN